MLSRFHLFSTQLPPDHHPHCFHLIYRGVLGFFGKHAAMSTLTRGSPPRKARRIARACDFCHARGSRCEPGETNSTCRNCVVYGELCTYHRPAKKRGIRPRNGPATEHPISATQDALSLNTTPATRPWQAEEIASQAMVMDLVEIYFQVVYPIFPFFHQPTTIRRVSRGEHQTSKSHFAVTMAMCALASARARDGAIFTNQWDLSALSKVSSETFFAAAESVLPKGPIKDFDVMRAFALLSITAIQYGQPRTMLYYLGLYHTCVEVDGLHDEANWSKDSGIVALEERRRLFWSMYTLDVYTSIAWRRVIRSCEAQSNVTYPTPVDDADFSDTGYKSKADSRGAAESSENKPLSWLHGWNATTDLYRILEHVVAQFRQRRPEHRASTSIDAIFAKQSTSSAMVLDSVFNMYEELPSRLKETPDAQSEADHRLNFQTANIAATVQLVRIMLLAAEDATVEQRCRVASELLQAFADVPIIYLRAISSPLLHHLASIGSILGSTFEGGLPESSYRKIRSVLLSMIKLLADLEVGLYCTAGASTRMQALVDRIDDFISTRQQAMYISQSHHENSADQQPIAQSATSPYLPGRSPLFLLPSELLDDWSWAFDFGQTVGDSDTIETPNKPGGEISGDL